MKKAFDNTNALIEGLNHINAEVRLDSLKKLMEKIHTGEMAKTPKGNDVNNHIHTFYSFSPYSPSKAVWMACLAGLATAGIMDHDSVSGAGEFIEAGKIAGIATTVGIECRADFSGTPLAGRKINNPDQASIAYIALHGIPHTKLGGTAEYFAPFSRQRNIRNRRMVEKINEIMPFGIQLDFSRDVEPLSMFREGGSITERHILYALSIKLIQTFGKGGKLLEFLTHELKLQIPSKINTLLYDVGNPYYDYDLLGLLKSELVESFYIDADSECPDVRDILAFSRSIGAIPAYAYLGDVEDSITGDKKTQNFEDGYLHLLFEVLKDLGFCAVTYAPSRNSRQQLEQVRSLCSRYSFFQISGEDINTPRQPFICESMRDDSFKNLTDSTWALIGHEWSATCDLSKSMFSSETCKKYPGLNERIQIYKEMASNFFKSG